MQITKLDLPRCSVGEGPVWDVSEQALYYIDILQKKVFRWDPATNDHRSWDVSDIIGALVQFFRTRKVNATPAQALMYAIQPLEVMIVEGWIKASLDPAKPRLRLSTPRNGEVITVRDGT